MNKVVMMSEKYRKCLRPLYVCRYDCAYVVWGIVLLQKYNTNHVNVI